MYNALTKVIPGVVSGQITAADAATEVQTEFARTEHRFALITIMIVPVFIAFLLLQRQFMSGLTAGAIKG